MDILIIYTTQFSQKNNKYSVNDLNHVSSVNVSFNSSVNMKLSMDSPSASVMTIYVILIIELFLSIIALVATIALLSWEKPIRLPQKVIITVCSCLLTTYICFIIDIFGRNSLSPALCQCLAILIYVSFLATFFWTNVMAFDLYVTIACSLSSRLVETQNYLYYSIYGWTATLLITLVAIIIDKVLVLPLRPGFGEGARCWLKDQNAYLIYFNSPVGLVLSINVTLYVLISCSLHKVQTLAEEDAGLSQRKESQNARYRLYIKLFFSMGLVWATEFIPLITGFTDLYKVAGLLNALYGVFLFLIFGLRRMRNPFHWRRGIKISVPPKQGRDRGSLWTITSSNASLN